MTNNNKSININSSVPSDLNAVRDIQSLAKSSNLSSLQINSNNLFENVSELSAMGNLTNLAIYHCERLHDLSTLSSLRKLESLTLSIGGSVSDITPLAECKNLKRLYLDDCKNICNFRVLQELPQLEILSLDDCGTMYEDDWSGMATKSKSIGIGYRKNSGASCGTHHVAGLPNLQSLYLTGFRCMRNLDVLKDLPSLTKLHLSGLRQLSDISALADLRALRNLYIYDNSTLRDLSALADLPNFEELSLSDCRGLIETGHIPTLRKLRLSSLPQFTNAEALLRHKLLEDITIEGGVPFENIDALADLKHLFKANISLNEIKSGSRLLTSPALQEIDIDSRYNIQSLPENSSLYSMHFRCNSELEDLSGLTAMENLKALEIYGCKNLRDLSPLCNLEGLETLKIANCELIRDISCLAECKSLKNLSLIDCKNIYDLRVLQELPQLESLSLCECGTLYDNGDSLEEEADYEAQADISERSSGASCSIHHIAGLKNLRSLILSGFRCMRNLELLKELSSLERLCLTDFYKLSDLSALTSLRNLRFLSIVNNFELFDLGALVDMPALEHISLSHCSELIETGNIPTLRKLELNDLPDFINIKGLLRHTQLEEITINRCKLVKNIGALANLKHLSKVCVDRYEVKSFKRLLASPSLREICM